MLGEEVADSQSEPQALGGALKDLHGFINVLFHVGLYLLDDLLHGCALVLGEDLELPDLELEFLEAGS